MGIPLSNRLLACAGFVRPGARVADVGCDHGYLGIHLLKTDTALRVYASDVRPGPLDCARRNAVKYGIGPEMTFYLADGVRGLPRDFDTMICAGMGADTMISILEAAPWLRDDRYRLILQCQSKVPALRRYVSDQGFAILRETLAEDGKFIYPVMELAYDPGEALTEAQCWLSPALLDCGCPLLEAYTRRVVGNVRKTVQGLSAAGGPEYQSRARLLRELEDLLEQ